MKKITIAVIAVVAIMVIAGGALAISFGNYVSEDKGSFTAELSTHDMIYTTTGIQTPDAGNTFVLALVTITNDKADDGISNNYLYMNIKADGITYGCDLWETSSLNHDKRYVLKNIGIGASDTSCYVFQIPKTADPNKAEIIYKGSWNLSGTTKYVQTEMEPMGNFEATISTADSVTLKDGTVYNAEPNMTLMLVKIKLTCNHGKISTRWTNYDVAVSGNAIWMIGSSSQLIEDPYVEVTLNKGESKVTTQMFSIPKVADLHKVTIEWSSTLSDVQGTVIIA